MLAGVYHWQFRETHENPLRFLYKLFIIYSVYLSINVSNHSSKLSQHHVRSYP